jgi:hypothetical protein
MLTDVSVADTRLDVHRQRGPDHVDRWPAHG